MTLEQILDCSAAQLKAMTDAELLQHFQQYFPTTRPELVIRSQNRQPVQQIVLTPQKQAVMQMMAAQGVDLSFLRRRKK